MKEMLISSLKYEGYLRTKLVEDAIRNVPREDFIWSGSPESVAYVDEPVPLGQTGQTISAPHMVALMLEEMELSAGLKILEVGGGSGYNAALLGYIASGGGKEKDQKLVISIERDHSLVEFAIQNIRKVGLQDVVDVVEGDGTLGFPRESRNEIYDRIMVAAGAPRVPRFLKLQLKLGGLMEVPVGTLSYQKLLKLRKKKAESGNVEFTTENLVDCMFVPLVGEDAHK